MSKPYYDFFLHSFGLPLLLLMGIGPLVAWRRASLRALGRMFLMPFAVARRHRRGADRARLRLVAAGPARVHVLGVRRSRRSCSSSCAARARAALDRRALVGPQPAPLRRLPRARCDRPARDRRRRLEPYQTVREQGLKPGQAMTVAGYTLTYRGSARRRRRTRSRRARRSTSRAAARTSTTLHPARTRIRSSSDVERGVDLPRSAESRRRLPDRRPDRPATARST